MSEQRPARAGRSSGAATIRKAGAGRRSGASRRGDLRYRFALWILIALIPVAIANIVQGVMALDRDREAARDRLVARALNATATQENMFAAAEQILRALSGIDTIRRGAEGCRALMTGVVSGLPYATNLVRIDPEGRLVCTALGVDGEVSFADTPWWHETVEERAFSISGIRHGQLSGRDVLVASLPLFRTDGTFDGALAISIDVAWFDTTLGGEDLEAMTRTALLSRSGTLIAGSLPATVLDRIAAGLENRASEMRSGTTGGLAALPDEDGRQWTYVVAPLLTGDAFVAIAAPSDRLFSWTYLNVTTSFILPVITVGLAMLVIWIATDRLVLRWLVYLRRVSAAYAAGHYALRLGRIEAAPAEFRDFGRSVESMAAAVQERDRRLREGLAQKTALVREIHHRIKNSLQIVTSLLSLEASQISDAEARRHFTTVRGRVDALALAHRLFREAEHGSEVELRDLVSEIAAQHSSGRGRAIRVAGSVVECALPTDLAVPLALFLNEALAHAARWIDGLRHATIEIAIEEDDDKKLILRVAARTAERQPRAVDGDGLDMLIEGFAAQLRGRIRLLEEAGGARVIELVFPNPCL